jgi:hypothetical protein
MESPKRHFEALIGVRGGVMGGVPHGVRRDEEDIVASKGCFNVMWGWASTILNVGRRIIFILIFFKENTRLGDIELINGLGVAK